MPPSPLSGLRICLVSHSGKNGGAECVLLETIEVLQGQGAECRVVMPEAGPLCDELRKLGVPFTVISFPHWMGRGKPRIAARLKAAVGIALNSVYLAGQIRYWKSNLVYTNTVTVCVGAFAARLAGVPHVWHLQEFGYEDHGLSFLFWEGLCTRLVNALSRRCLCVSRALSGQYAKYVDAGKLAVVYPSMHRSWRAGAGLREPSAASQRTKWFRCAIVGTLIDGKGQDESVSAVAELKKAGIDVELILVGEGLPAYRRRLSELIATHEVADRVFFAGYLSNPFTLVQSADAVLMCSKREAFGRVTIEGMLAGKPVIGTRSGATAELIQDGVTGLLYESGNSQDLAAKIRCLYEGPEVASRLGRDAEAWARQHFTSARYRRELLKALGPVCLSEGTLAGAPAPNATA